jgi:hypothetical protein
MKFALLILFASYMLFTLAFAQHSALCAREDAPYRIIGLTDEDTIVDNCSFPCFKSNCSQTAVQAYSCPTVTWIAFVPSDVECEMWGNWSYEMYTYAVFAVDEDREMIWGTLARIPNSFTKAMNYGCALVTLWPGAMWFGMGMKADEERYCYMP